MTKAIHGFLKIFLTLICSECVKRNVIIQCRLIKGKVIHNFSILAFLCTNQPMVDFPCHHVTQKIYGYLYLHDIELELRYIISTSLPIRSSLTIQNNNNASNSISQYFFSSLNSHFWLIMFE